MKVRQGFVSNSSSSSFVLIVEKEWYDQCFKEADEYTQHVVKAVTLENEKVLNVPAAVLSGWYGSSGKGYLDEIADHSSEDLEGDYLDDRYKAVDNFDDLVKREPDKFFLHTEDI